MYDVITIGGAVRDAIFYFSQEKGKKRVGKFICFLSGVKINVEKLFFTTGGGACNVAVGLANFGLRVAPIACIGQDTSGEALIKDLKQKKVETKFIQIDQRSHTGVSSVINPQGSDRTVLTYRGANDNLQIDVQQLPKTKWIYLASLSGDWKKLLNEIFNLKYSAKGRSMLGRRTGLSDERKLNFKIAWNPGILQLKAGRKKLEAFLKKTDILILNKTEASILTGRSEKNIPLLLTSLYKFCPNTIAVTCGKEGAYVMNGKEIIYEPSRPIKVVDSNGAGDSFSSGLLAGLILYKDIRKALRLGILNSISNLRVIGAQEGLLTKKDLKKLKL